MQKLYKMKYYRKDHERPTCMQWASDKLPEIIVAFPSLNFSLFYYLFSEINKLCQACTNHVVRKCVFFAFRFGSREYIFERFNSFVRNNGGLFVYLSQPRLILYKMLFAHQDLLELGTAGWYCVFFIFAGIKCRL